MASFRVETLVDSEYNVNIQRSRGKIVCSVWWNMLNYFNLERDVGYYCPLIFSSSHVLPYWVLSFEKSETVVSVTLRCNIVDREVSFSMVADGCHSPLIVTAGREDAPGLYSTTVACSALHHYAEFLAKANFLVHCRLALQEEDLLDPSFPNPACSCGNLTHDLDNLFTMQKFSDIRLIREEGDLPAHRCFLVARSRSLGSLFASEIYENKTNIRLEYDHRISFASVIEALRYIYTGTTSQLDAQLTVSLYFLAQAFELQGLQERCMDFFKRNISVSDFMRICNFAINVKDKPLTDEVEAFFVRNKRDIVKQCYSADGETMVRPSWINYEEYVKMEMEMKRLRTIDLTTKFLEYNQLTYGGYTFSTHDK